MYVIEYDYYVEVANAYGGALILQNVSNNLKDMPSNESIKNTLGWLRMQDKDVAI